MNKYDFQKGEKVIFVDKEEGTIEHIYIMQDFKETNDYYLDVKTNNGDTWTFVCNDNINEEQLKQSEFYKVVHKIGNRVFGELLTKEEIEEIQKQVEQDNLDSNIIYIEGKNYGETKL